MRTTRRGSRGTLGLLAALLCSLVPLCADAYQHAGHYYSVNFAYEYLMRSAPDEATAPRFDPQDVRVIAFCTQLPDQSSDLDAVSVYWHAMSRSTYSWLKWTLADHLDSEPILKMVLVQQLLHALTGGDAKAVQSAAGASVSRLALALSTTHAGTERDVALCALGFAMHLYGDSYAHTRMDSPTLMYPTGRGHAWDMHYPDYPLCAGFASGLRTEWHCKLSTAGRFSAWTNYLRNIYPAIYPGAAVPDSYSNSIADVVRTIYAARASAWDGNGWNESEIQTALYSPGQTKSLESFFSQHRSSKPCTAVLGAALAADGPLQGVPAFTCQAAWTAFAEVAKVEFVRQGPRTRSNQRWDPDPLAPSSAITPF